MNSMEKLQAKIAQMSQHFQKTSMCEKNEEPSYICKKCKDIEFIEIEKGLWRECSCRAVKQSKKRIAITGISKLFEKRNFQNFEAKTKRLEKIKSVAIEYANIFAEKPSNIMFCGRTGSGKTHLACAIGNELLRKEIPIVFMNYRSEFSKLKANRLEKAFDEMFNYFKKTPVLVLDDLFKGATTEADIRLAFELIDYRYTNMLSTIVTTEYTIEGLVKIDESITGRLVENARGKIILFDENIENYRFT